MDQGSTNTMAENDEIVSDVAQKAFSLASSYENIRQGYPVEAVKFFLHKLGLTDKDGDDPSRDRHFTILELGCGTGKFTRVMLEVLKGKNVKVIAAEPVENMCEQFRQILPDTEIIQCPAEKIPLPDGSVDVVIAAQSFHWFTNRAALEEIHRVLTPNGSFGMVWKMSDFSVPWQTDVCKFLDRSDQEIGLVFPYQEEWKKAFSRLSQHIFSAPEEFIGFEYTVKSSFDHAFNFFSSLSPIAGGREPTKKDFVKVFNEITKKHFKDKGIPLDAIQFKIYMYWCMKEN